MITRYALPVSLLAVTISIVALILTVQTEMAAHQQVTDLAEEIRQLNTIRLAMQGRMKSAAPNLVARYHRTGVAATPTQQRVAADKAELILQNAISKGILTRSEVFHMRRLKLAVGGGPGFDKLTRQIFQALNARKIVAQDPMAVVP